MLRHIVLERHIISSQRHGCPYTKKNQTKKPNQKSLYLNPIIPTQIILTQFSRNPKFSFPSFVAISSSLTISLSVNFAAETKPRPPSITSYRLFFFSIDLHLFLYHYLSLSLFEFFLCEFASVTAPPCLHLVFMFEGRSSDSPELDGTPLTCLLSFGITRICA